MRGQQIPGHALPFTKPFTNLGPGAGDVWRKTAPQEGSPGPEMSGGKRLPRRAPQEAKKKNDLELNFHSYPPSIDPCGSESGLSFVRRRRFPDLQWESPFKNPTWERI